MLLIIFVSFFLTGAFSFYHFKKENELHRREQLRRKEYAVMQAIDYFLRHQELSPHTDSIVRLFDNKICELARVNSMDINIYALNGELLISSRPQLFQEGVLEPQIPFYIMEQLHQTSEQVLRRNYTDSLSFLSTYDFIRNYQEKPIAIVQIPYFSSQEKPRQDLQAFLMRLGEIYFLLFLAAGFLAYLLSNYITGSLQAITEKIKNTRISEKNPPLQWSFHDEIGTLVDEYNRMVEELEQSAVKLAQTERESAWKEMARQVAHEIKNPLTPMRLNVQHLEKSLQTDQPDKLRQFSRGMISQIDSLSNIAEAFSRFASLPEAQLQDVKLSELLERVASLYSEEQVLVQCDPPHLHIQADPDQLLRVMNNLLNNSLQAIPADRDPQLQITACREEDQVRISISDNGLGIPQEQQEKIFEPRFTTKSRGMGLGLALVKRIIDNHQGHIELESVPQQGTSFHLILPIQPPVAKGD